MKPLQENLCLVEYSGTAAGITCTHGNRKDEGTSEYVRTTNHVLENISAKFRDREVAPRTVYEQMTLDDSFETPRDLKQIQNRKYVKEKCKPENKYQARKNEADDIQVLLGTIHEDDFIQEIIQGKEKVPPSIIVYTRRQLEDIQRMCTNTTESPSTVGIDRTFNLSSCFVTLTVYENNKLRRKGCNTSPILMGPSYLHWKADYASYHRFFSHLKGRLSADIAGSELGGKSIVLGSDEEKALVKALQQNFPSATHVLCSRHVKNNVSRYLHHSAGANDEQVRVIQQEIFGEDGLLSSADTSAFDLRGMELQEQYAYQIPSFAAYFDKLLQVLRNQIYKPTIDGFIPLNWTNNNCESINHILKLCTNWKLLKVPELIKKLHNIVKLQEADVRKAVHGQGNYELSPLATTFRVPHSVWMTMTSEAKEAAMSKFYKGTIRESKMVVSCDQKLTIPATPKQAKKPGQKTRCKATRTKSFPKQRCVKNKISDKKNENIDQLVQYFLHNIAKEQAKGKDSAKVKPILKKTSQSKIEEFSDEFDCQ